jgi:hypothetical protein
VGYLLCVPVIEHQSCHSTVSFSEVFIKRPRQGMVKLHQKGPTILARLSTKEPARKQRPVRSSNSNSHQSPHSLHLNSITSSSSSPFLSHNGLHQALCRPPCARRRQRRERYVLLRLFRSLQVELPRLHRHAVHWKVIRILWHDPGHRMQLLQHRLATERQRQFVLVL